MTILITGGSGFIGNELARSLSGRHEVVCLSRSKPKAEVPFVKGSFDSVGDLQGLDSYTIDTVIHLAAVTGDCSEEDGLAINVQGSRRLFRYLLDRGCRKFICASSIAAVGCLNRDFIPLQLPIPDDHPCLATDVYGFSKSMVEQLTGFLHRVHPDADFIHFRIGSVIPDDDTSRPVIDPETKLSVPFVQLGKVFVGDIVRAIGLAAEEACKPGVRVLNVVGPDNGCEAPTRDMLHALLGDRADGFDLSYYDRPGHAFKPLYAMERVERELGFRPERSTRRSTQTQEARD